MSSQVYIFALLTALFWGIVPVVNKRGLAIGGNPLQCALTMVSVTLVVFWVLLLGTQPGEDLFAHLSVRSVCIFGLAGFAGTALGRVTSAAGVDRVGATINSAALSSRPLIATLIAMLWLGEPAKPPLFAGIVLLVAGVVTLVFSKGGNITGWRKRELWSPLMGATVFALGNVIRRFGLSTTPLPVLEALVINQTAAFSALAGYGLIWRRSQVLSAPRRSYLFFSISGVLGAIALFSMFEALDRGPIAIVDPLVGTQSLFTILVAYFVLHDLERITLRLIVGAVLVVLGASIIIAFDTVLK
jgi:uncharacterized membrane protein